MGEQKSPRITKSDVKAHFKYVWGKRKAKSKKWIDAQVAKRKKEEPELPKDFEFGVETLFLPFGVSKGWADEYPTKFRPGSFTPPFNSGVAPIAATPLPRPYDPPKKVCSKLLFIPAPTEERKAYRGPSKEAGTIEFCQQAQDHEGKHGRPDVTYAKLPKPPEPITIKVLHDQYGHEITETTENGVKIVSKAHRYSVVRGHCPEC